MGWMFRISGFLVSLVLTCAALAGTAAMRAEVAVAAEPALRAQEPDPGERIMNASCQGCHDVRTIQTQAMDAAGWTKTIDTMIVNGAEIAKEDIPVLVKYLAFQFGPLPDGPGKRIVLNTCTMCHDLGRIKFGRRSPEEWEETLSSMLNEGAPLSDEEFPIVHHYLSQHFGVQ
jgi:cytochrome c5